MSTTQIIILIIVALIGGCWWAIKKDNLKFETTMKELNARHGTAFGIARDDVNTIVGMTQTFAFDPKNRKIAYLSKRGKSVELLDYSFIRGWQLTWDKKTSASGAQIGFVAVGSSDTRRSNAVLIIETNDLRRPIIKLSMPTVGYGENAYARLSLLINGRA